MMPKVLTGVLLALCFLPNLERPSEAGIFRRCKERPRRFCVLPRCWNRCRVPCCVPAPNTCGRNAEQTPGAPEGREPIAEKQPPKPDWEPKDAAEAEVGAPPQMVSAPPKIPDVTLAALPKYDLAKPSPPPAASVSMR